MSTRVDGSVQIFFGAISVRSVSGSRELFFAGTYFHNGIGPLPWTALGIGLLMLLLLYFIERH